MYLTEFVEFIFRRVNPKNLGLLDYFSDQPTQCDCLYCKKLTCLCLVKFKSQFL